MGSLNLRNALMAGKRLPYDAEVEYLESTGTQWIDLGFRGTNLFTCDIGLYRATTTPYWGFGYNQNWSGGGYANSCGGFFESNGWMYLYVVDGNGMNWGSASITHTPRAGDIQLLITRNNTTGSVTRTIKAEGLAFTKTNTVQAFATDGNLCLFKSGNASAPPATSSGMRLKYCKIKDGDNIVDLIPVRKGNVGYMYDRVSGKLFGNQGTGDFVLGPDVVPVEYIESHGTEYVDTGLNYFADFEIGIKLRANVANKSLGTSGTMCMDRYNARQPYWRLQVNGTDYISSARITDYHIMSWKNGVFAADGVTAHTVSNPFSSGTMTLFGAGGYNYPNMIYACKLWDANGVFVRSFRPIRVGTDATSWAGAMMDVLTRRIYRNQGTGAFTYGNDLKYPIPAE